jgi:hypothetical protein
MRLSIKVFPNKANHVDLGKLSPFLRSAKKAVNSINSVFAALGESV